MPKQKLNKLLTFLSLILYFILWKYIFLKIFDRILKNNLLSVLV